MKPTIEVLKSLVIFIHDNEYHDYETGGDAKIIDSKKLVRFINTIIKLYRGK